MDERYFNSFNDFGDLALEHTEIRGLDDELIESFVGTEGENLIREYYLDHKSEIDNLMKQHDYLMNI